MSTPDKKGVVMTGGLMVAQLIMATAHNVSGIVPHPRQKSTPPQRKTRTP